MCYGHPKAIVRVYRINDVVVRCPYLAAIVVAGTLQQLLDAYMLRGSLEVARAYLRCGIAHLAVRRTCRWRIHEVETRMTDAKTCT